MLMRYRSPIKFIKTTQIHLILSQHYDMIALKMDWLILRFMIWWVALSRIWLIVSKMLAINQLSRMGRIIQVSLWAQDCIFIRFRRKALPKLRKWSYFNRITLSTNKKPHDCGAFCLCTSNIFSLFLEFKRGKFADTIWVFIVKLYEPALVVQWIEQGPPKS